jgi:Uma2 family endonuclease
VFQFEGSEVEPDLMVRQPPARARTAWKDAPLPILIVEVFSPYTRRRDQIEKRTFYLDAGIAEYWMVDPEDASITVVRPGREDETVRDWLAWSPRAGAPALDLPLGEIFGVA